MADRRMFSKTIIDSDSFLDMPLTTQALYFHLSMRADDDGFINNPKKIMRMIGCTEDDLKLLIAKNFIIPFETGIVVIKHWKIHNYIQSDRYKPTVYQEEKAQLVSKPNKAYTLDTECIHDVSKTDTQVRLGKVRLGKVRLGKVNIEREDAQSASSTRAQETRHKYGEYNNVLLTDKELDKLLNEYPDDWQQRIDNLSAYMKSTGKTYKDHLATIRNWARRDQERSKGQTPTIGEAPKNTKAQELDDFYKRMAAWAEKEDENQ